MKEELKRCEISDVEQAVLRIFHEMFPWFTNDAPVKSTDFIAAIRPYLATREPVSVSLKTCTDAIYGAALNRATFSDCKVHDTREFSQTLAKAVLDAAGMAYVD